MKLTPVFLILALANCSAKNCKLKTYPLPKPEELQVIEVLKCSKDDVNLCVQDDSAYRFVEIQKVLSNNQKLRKYIEDLKNNPTWEK